MVHRSHDLSSTLNPVSKELPNQLLDPIWALRWASHTLEGFQACIRPLEFRIIPITPFLTPWWHLLLHNHRCITSLQYLRLDDAPIRKCLLRYHNFDLLINSRLSSDQKFIGLYILWAPLSVMSTRFYLNIRSVAVDPFSPSCSISTTNIQMITRNNSIARLSESPSTLQTVGNPVAKSGLRKEEYEVSWGDLYLSIFIAGLCCCIWCHSPSIDVFHQAFTAATHHRNQLRWCFVYDTNNSEKIKTCQIAW